MSYVDGVSRIAESASEGLVAGVLATAAMSLFTAALLALVETAGSKREADSEAAHWTFGALLGVIYGLVSARAPRRLAGRGLAYGALIWLGGSEAGLPALRRASSKGGHAMNLATHLVYGAALDRAARGLHAAHEGRG
jgi:hypothetical protein